MIESLDWGRYILSLVGVGLMIVVLAYLTKRVGLAAKMKNTKSINGHMEVVDTLYIDPRRRILLVRCKNEEHMILLSGDQAHPMTTKKEQYESPTG